MSSGAEQEGSQGTGGAGVGSDEHSLVKLPPIEARVRLCHCKAGSLPPSQGQNPVAAVVNRAQHDGSDSSTDADAEVTRFHLSLAKDHCL